MSDPLVHLNGDREPYVPAAIPPDPARDARVAARRAVDARRAGAALDRLLNRWHFPDGPDDVPHTELSDAFVEAVGDYVLSRLHHNRHYGVPADRGDPDGPDVAPWVDQHDRHHGVSCLCLIDYRHGGARIVDAVAACPIHGDVPRCECQIDLPPHVPGSVRGCTSSVRKYEG